MAENAVREIADRDIEDVVALWRASGLTRPWNDPYADIAFARRSENATVLVAEESGAIMAGVMVGHDGHRGWVYYLASSPDRRGTGLGRLMLEAAENWLRDRGVWKVQLLVRRDNEAVTAFYKHLDYHELDVVCMQKGIDGAGNQAERGDP